jgi:hypothetical protein
MPLLLASLITTTFARLSENDSKGFLAASEITFAAASDSVLFYLIAGRA